MSLLPNLGIEKTTSPNIEATDRIHASIASEYTTEEFTVVTDSQDKILEFLCPSSMSPKDIAVNVLKAVDHRMTGHKHENFAVRKREFSI